MAYYALNLPSDLQRKAEQLAIQQGVSLDQFILWSVAEKVSSLQQPLGDPKFPGITYQQGASGVSTAVLRGTGIRVQTVVVDIHHWRMTSAQVAAEYDLAEEQIHEALEFYRTHQAEIDAQIAIEGKLAEGYA